MPIGDLLAVGDEDRILDEHDGTSARSLHLEERAVQVFVTMYAHDLHDTPQRLPRTCCLHLREALASR